MHESPERLRRCGGRDGLLRDGLLRPVSRSGPLHLHDLLKGRTRWMTKADRTRRDSCGFSSSSSTPAHSFSPASGGERKYPEVPGKAGHSDHRPGDHAFYEAITCCSSATFSSLSFSVRASTMRRITGSLLDARNKNHQSG